MEDKELQAWFESLNNLLSERVQLTGKEHQFMATGLKAAHVKCFPPVETKEE
jgi:hypothetical protein